MIQMTLAHVHSEFIQVHFPFSNCSELIFPERSLTEMAHWSPSSCFVVIFRSRRADMRSLPHRIIDNEFFPWSHLNSLLVCTFIYHDHRVNEKQCCYELQMINAHFRLIYSGTKLGAGAICLWFDFHDTHCWCHRGDTKAFCVIVIIINSATQNHKEAEYHCYHGWMYKSQRPNLVFFHRGDFTLHKSSITVCFPHGATVALSLHENINPSSFRPNQFYAAASHLIPAPSTTGKRGVLMWLCSHGAL